LQVYIPNLVQKYAYTCAHTHGKNLRSPYSGLEDEEGEGRWKPAAGAAPSTLASAADRTRVGKVVGFFGSSVERLC
jgi:hypothetical protein